MANATLHFAPLIPPWAIAVVAVGLLGLLAHGSGVLARRRVPRPWIGLLAGLRVAVVVVFVLCLMQPVFSYRTSARRQPEMAVLLDTSRSMSRTDGAGGASRLETARSWLRSGPLADALRDRYRLRFFSFDRSARPLRDGDIGAVAPTGETTRLADSLVAACAAVGQNGADDAEDRGRMLPRVLVVGDGVDLGGNDPADTARRLGVTVDTLTVGGTAAVADEPRVVIASLRAPRRVLAGAEAQFDVTLRRDGNDERPWVLSLIEAGRTLDTQDVVFQAGQGDRTVRMNHRPGEPGLHDYEFRLAPPAEAAAPAGVEPYRISLRVVDRKHEVLLLEDTWRWEFKFLRRILEDDPSFSLTALVTRPGGSVVQMGEADRRVNLAGMPASRSELEWFDMYVLGDVKPAGWSRGMASALASLVRDEGKSLVVIAGPNIGAIAATPELAAILPVEVVRESGTPIEGPVEVRVSREGLSTPFFANPPAPGGRGPAAAAAPPVPGGLPPLDQIYPPLRKRPAATVLVEAVKQSNSYGPLIVMAEHTVGRGRVLFIGTDTLWKWHMIADTDDAGITPFMIFWQQTLRALAPSRPFAGGISLDVVPDRTRYEAGQRIVVRAEVGSDRPLVAPVIRASVLAPSARAGEPIPLAFPADPARPDTFVAAFAAAEPGQHLVTAAVITSGRTAAEVTTAIDVEPEGLESDRSAADADALARLAAATGGRVIDPADPKTFPVVDDVTAGLVDRTASLDLWNDHVLLLLLCLLLGADWGIRLLRGFV